MKHCQKCRNLFGEALYNELSSPQKKGSQDLNKNS